MFKYSSIGFGIAKLMALLLPATAFIIILLIVCGNNGCENGFSDLRDYIATLDNRVEQG